MNEQTSEPARLLQGESSAKKSQLAVSGETDEAFTPGRIFGVALLGAFSSLLVYYAYSQLEAESKHSLKKGVVSLVKGQVRNFVGSDD